MAKSKDLNFVLSLFFVSFLYLLLRILYPETIEFGYDQPRLSSVIMDYLNNGNFMKLQYFSLPTAWENLSWGPSLILFNSIFLFISRDPIAISYFVILFNILSVITILIIGYKFFSPTVGLIAAVVVATHPWWVVFSRMIYQPTPILTLISISIYFLFKVVNDKKSAYIIPLLISWGVILQMYLITFSFVVACLVILTVYTRFKLNYKYVLASVPFLVAIYLPSFKYYIDNPNIFMKLFEFKGRYTTTFVEAFVAFIKNLSGLNFKWQLGYAYEDFISTMPYFKFSSVLLVVVVILILLCSIYFAFKNKNKYELSSLIILISPLWAIPMVGVEYVVPRYYLYILPVFALVFANTFVNLTKYSKIFLIPLFMTIIFWIIFMLNYFNFIKSYNYPSGLLSLWSDPPYYYLDKSFRWIIEDSSSKFDSFTVSSDFDHIYENRFNDAQTYYWNYVLDSKYKNSSSNNVGHYLMYYAPSKDIGQNSKQIGPYVIERLESDPTKFINPKNTPQVD